MFKGSLSIFLLAAGIFAAVPVAADEPPPSGRPPLPGLTIISPANGAQVEGTFEVRYAVKEPSPGGRAGDMPPPASGAGGGGPEGGRDGVPPPPPGAGGPAGRNGLRVLLLIDAPPPESGSPIYADGGHLLFPAGQKSAPVSLRRGRHRLQLVLLEPDGRVGDVLVTSPSVMVDAQ